MRGIVVLLVLLAGCATATKREPMLAWSPPADWWKSASITGGRLVEKDGTAHQLTPTQVSNLAEAHEKLGKESGIAAKLTIVKAEQVNAFATVRQGESIVAFTIPFIRALGDDKDAIASVMGHELAHLKLEHGTARKQRHETATGVSNVLGRILNMAGVPLGGTLASLGATAVTTAFSRDEERDADELGNKWAVAAGFDPCGAVRSMRVLQARSQTFHIPFLSTHPGHSERIDRANQLSLKLRNTPC
jgi:predicted Zn-dependent protease